METELSASKSLMRVFPMAAEMTLLPKTVVLLIDLSWKIFELPNDKKMTGPVHVLDWQML